MAFSWAAGEVTAYGADIGVRPPGEIVRPDPATYRDALIRRSVLYGLRAHFNVISRGDIPLLLKADATHLATAAQIAVESDDIDRDLIAEGSYYIVSLRYLIEFGSANWPLDKSASHYQNDALVMLEDLQERWLVAVGDGGDLPGILDSVDLINAWTEGSPTLTPEYDDFSDLPALVDVTIANFSPWSNS